ncbi:hypothetical protein LUCX_296 [Xanthomonas phage vB_XciM_LucasX]|nr:hypothetical protein LUCX_296 [Xanthomonas phage vB_XciM_LucasX]
MSKPLPGIFAVLRQLELTKAGVAKLHFVVETEEGLRHLSVDEFLKLISSTKAPQQIALANPAVDPNDPQILALQKAIDGLRAQVNERITDLEPYYVEQSPQEAFVPDESVALGTDALLGGAVDRENVAIGLCAGLKLDGDGNVAIGPYASHDVDGVLTDTVAIGREAMADLSGDFENVVALGAYTHPSGSHQVILGDTRANVYTASSPQRRNDARDFTQIKDNPLGLEFILGLRTIQYQEDFRERYIDWDNKPIEPTAPGPEPERPQLALNDPNYQSTVVSYRLQKSNWDKQVAQYEIDMATYVSNLDQWVKDNQMHRLNPDGSKAGKRIHLGLAQGQLKQQIERTGLDLAMIQDHAVAGGASVQTIADVEAIAPLIKAVQELHAELHSATTIDRLASALMQRHTELTEQAIAELSSAAAALSSAKAE